MLDIGGINLKSLGCIQCSSVIQCNLHEAFGEKLESKVKNAAGHTKDYRKVEKEYNKANKDISDSQWKTRIKFHPHLECFCSKLRPKFAR